MNTVIHITHWKAGSSWMRRILRRLAPDRFLRPEMDGIDPFPNPVPEGCVYSCYSTREQYEAAELPPHRRFIVVRDLRDTLVSGYFSIRDTHRPTPHLDPQRKRLRELEKEDGLIYLMDEFLPGCAAIQESWRGEPVIRYEDLLFNDFEILERVLLDECGLEVPRRKLERVVRNKSFESITGRELGEEASDHLRQGLPGDWENHFTPRVLEEFERRFGSPAGFEGE